MFPSILASIVLSAFTFEGYLNHVGKILFKSWDEIEKNLSWSKKLSLISEILEIKIDYGAWESFCTEENAIKIDQDLEDAMKIIHSAGKNKMPSKFTDDLFYSSGYQTQDLKHKIQ